MGITRSTEVCARAVSLSSSVLPLSTLRVRLIPWASAQVEHTTTANIISVLPLDGLLRLDSEINFREDVWRAAVGKLPRLRVSTFMQTKALTIN